ncbi:hypothetical protein [Paludisphaera rhizosphaerae]|uniref:hypothetical protein n=1 Tax=Paludisphaera rhizosphaerae TaxID=2711216 RepID=UPI0013EC3C38|nr:hypothetical protein [Paludisphaera rhizosphaerae]
MAKRKPYFIVRWQPPTEVARLPKAERLRYWALAAEQVLKVKDGDLAKGLAADGKPLGRPSTKWLRHRRSAMTATGSGDPSAPLFQPGNELSRVRSLLTARGYDGWVRVWWRYDPHTHREWGEILAHWASVKGERWNVLGMPEVSVRAARRQAEASWRKQAIRQPVDMKTVYQPVRNVHTLPVERGGRRPQTLDVHTGSMEEIARASRDGRFSGWMTPTQLDQFWREGRAVKPVGIPSRTAPVILRGVGNRQLEATWGASPVPPKPTPGFLRKITNWFWAQLGV